jgi:RND family efflux transporter MFP subunit
MELPEMMARSDTAKRRHPSVRLLSAAALLALLAACKRTEAPVAEDIRPVRSITVEKQTAGDTVTLTGHIYAQDEVSLSFRIGGRMLDRPVNVGDRVTAGQVIARLDPAPWLDALATARANVAAAMAQLVQARNHFNRQDSLVRDGWTTRANWDQALQAQQTAQAQVDAAEAALNTARNNVAYTQLEADSDGAVTARGAEPGEVVQAGRMIVQLARQGGRDAVFDVPARVLTAAPPDPLVTVFLTSDPTVRTTGLVREVAPQADPVTRTFAVRVGLKDAPEAMRLGSTVTGSLQLGDRAGIDIPASALTTANRQPAVWVVDPKTNTVSLRNIDVQRYDISTVLVAQGLEPGDVVVTAGVQTLRPGQKIRLLGAAS